MADEALTKQIVDGVHQSGGERIIHRVARLLKERYRDFHFMVRGLMDPDPPAGASPEQIKKHGEEIDKEILAVAREMVTKDKIKGRDLHTVKLPASFKFEGKEYDKDTPLKKILDDAIEPYTKPDGIFDRIGNAIAGGVENASPSWGDYFAGFFTALKNFFSGNARFGFFDEIKACVADRVLARNLPSVKANLDKIAEGDSEVADALKEMGGGDLNKGKEAAINGFRQGAYGQAGIILSPQTEKEDLSGVALQSKKAHQETVADGIGKFIKESMTPDDLNLLAVISGGKINSTKKKQFAQAMTDVLSKATADGIKDKNTITNLIQARLGPGGEFRLTKEQAALIAQKTADDYSSALARNGSPTARKSLDKETFVKLFVPEIKKVLERTGSGAYWAIFDKIEQDKLATITATSLAEVTLNSTPPAADMNSSQLQARLQEEIKKQLPGDIKELLKTGVMIPPQLLEVLNKDGGRDSIAAMIAATYMQDDAGAKTAMENLQNQVHLAITQTVDDRWTKMLDSLPEEHRGRFKNALGDKQDKIKEDIVNALVDLTRNGNTPSEADIQNRVERELQNSLPDSGGPISLGHKYLGVTDVELGSGSVAPKHVRGTLAMVIAKTVTNPDAKIAPEEIIENLHIEKEITAAGHVVSAAAGTLEPIATRFPVATVVATTVATTTATNAYVGLKILRNLLGR